MPGSGRENGDLNPGNCAVKNWLFYDQHEGPFYPDTRFRRAESQVLQWAPLLPSGRSSVCARHRAGKPCEQMDGLELSALNDFSDAHGKFYTGLLEGNRSHEQRAQGWAVLRASQTCQHPDTPNHMCQLGSKAQIL